MTGSRRIRWWWVLAAFAGGIATAMWAEELILRAQGNRLDFSAEQIHYLTTGRPFDRMKNAEQVGFDFKVTLAAGSREAIIRTQTARFLISYDLFEERYKVDEVLPQQQSRSRLTAAAAEAWCIQIVSGIDTTGIDAKRPLWAHMEIRAEDEVDRSLFGIPDERLSLRALVDLLSSKPRKTQPRWNLEAGPVTLEQLRRGG